MGLRVLQGPGRFHAGLDVIVVAGAPPKGYTHLCCFPFGSLPLWRPTHGLRRSLSLDGWIAGRMLDNTGPRCWYTLGFGHRSWSTYHRAVQPQLSTTAHAGLHHPLPCGSSMTSADITWVERLRILVASILGFIHPIASWPTQVSGWTLRSLGPFSKRAISEGLRLGPSAALDIVTNKRIFSGAVFWQLA